MPPATAPSPIQPASPSQQNRIEAHGEFLRMQQRDRVHPPAPPACRRSLPVPARRRAPWSAMRRTRFQASRSSRSPRSGSGPPARGRRHRSAAHRRAPCRAGSPPARRRPSDSARHCRAWRDRAAAARYTDGRARSARGIWRKKNVSSSVRICEPSTSASVMMTMRW